MRLSSPLIAVGVLLVVSAAACTSNTPTVSGFPGLAITAKCRAGRTATYSIVDGKYPGERAADDFLGGKFLRSIDELPVPCVDPRGETYRMYWSGGGEFGGYTMVTINLGRDRSRLRVVWKPYGGEFMPVRRVERALLESEWNGVAAQLSAIGFWTQPARLMPDPHGENWSGHWKLIEGYAGGRYHKVRRAPQDDLLEVVLKSIRELTLPLIVESTK